MEMSRLVVSAALLFIVACCSDVALGRVTSIPHRGALYDGLAMRALNHHNIPAVSADAPEQWFTQALDHFDPRNSAKWQQRYFTNDTFYRPGGPVFLMLGGEGPASPIDVGGHFILNEYAQRFNALVLSIEHRFYGKSVPTRDLSNANLRFLNSEQALADFAMFRQYISEKLALPKTTKWVAFGGSYSGALSAWFRLKYPHLVDGSLATSAPVKAQLDFSEYNEVVQRSLEFFVGESCANRVREGTQAATNLLSSADGKKQLQKLFNLCTPIETDDDIALFFENMEGTVAQIVQYNNDNNNYNHGMNINKMCDIFLKGDDALAAYAEFNTVYNKLFGVDCTQTKYTEYVNQLKDVRTFPENDNAAGRSWTYQTCIEFGFYQTGSAANQPFSKTVTLDWYLKQCRDIFNIDPFNKAEPLPNIEWTNTFYGSTGLADPKVILPNGSIDPWHILGVLPETAVAHPGQLAVLINGTAHCADLYPSSADDPLSLKDARAKIVAAIASFIH